MPAKTEPVNVQTSTMGGEQLAVRISTDSSASLYKDDTAMSENSISDKKLKYYNIGAGVLHFIQGMIMLVSSQAVSNIKSQGARDVTLRYLGCITNNSDGGRCGMYPENVPMAERAVKLDTMEYKIGTLEIGAVAAAFLLLSAVAHGMIVVFFKRYISDINRGINVFRWYEYSLSSSVMIVAIAALFGMQDLASIILMFLVNCSMNLFGLLMERMNMGVNKKHVNWEPFIFGCVAGIAPWVAVALYFFGGPLDQIPGFVYGIVFSYFVFFQTFPVNMFLQYKRIGIWKNYRAGEIGYQILSLVSKSLLSWLIFFGTFQPQNN